MRPSLILETAVGALFHTALLFSLFLLLAGHNAPGGGFVGGLVAGAAFVLRYVAGGADEVARLARVAPERVLGVGIVTAVGTAVGAWAFGGELLESGSASPELPVFGVVKMTTALPFDIGVYLVVVGLVLTLLCTLGAEEARR